MTTNNRSTMNMSGSDSIIYTEFRPEFQSWNECVQSPNMSFRPINAPIEQMPPLIQKNTEQPMQQLMQQPMQQPMQQLMQQPVQQPMQQPMQQPVQQLVHQPVQQPVQQPMQQLVHQPVQQPTQPPPMQQPIEPCFQPFVQYTEIPLVISQPIVYFEPVHYNTVPNKQQTGSRDIGSVVETSAEKVVQEITDQQILSLKTKIDELENSLSAMLQKKVKKWCSLL